MKYGHVPVHQDQPLSPLPPDSIVSPRLRTEICRSHRKEELNEMWHLKTKRKASMCVQKKNTVVGGQSSDKSVPSYRALVRGKGGEEGSSLSESEEAG